MELFITIYMASGFVTFRIADFSGSEPAANYKERQEKTVLIALLAQKYAMKHGATVDSIVIEYN